MYNIELRNFILEHDNWEDLLTNEPYYLKIKRKDGYIIFNYTGDSQKDLSITREARGIIFKEDDWDCVCHSFNRFFNYGNEECDKIELDDARVTEKIDGTLIRFWYDKVWHISTKRNIDANDSTLNISDLNSFFDLVQYTLRKMKIEDITNYMDKNYTYYFELATPYNRVVVPYKDFNLYFIGMRNMIIGEEETPFIDDISSKISYPKTYLLTSSLETVQMLANKLSADEEGFVIVDKNYNRCKIKSKEWMLSHYIRQNNNPTLSFLINIILHNKEDEYLAYCEDFKNLLYDVKRKMKIIYNIALDTRYIIEKYSNNNISSKNFAIKIKEQYPGWLFKLMMNEYRGFERIEEQIKKWDIHEWKRRIKEIENDSCNFYRTR